MLHYITLLGFVFFCAAFASCRLAHVGVVYYNKLDDHHVKKEVGLSERRKAWGELNFLL